MSLSSRIRQARLGRGLSQARLAELMNVTRSACSQWEVEGGTVPRGHRLERLAALLGVSVEWLTTGSERGSMSAKDQSAAYKRLLSDDERALIEGYNSLDAPGKRALLALLSTLTKRRR